MADTAAHLVDRVLPLAPYRQWVFTVPKPLRLVLARDPAWTRWTGALVVRAILRFELLPVPTNAEVLAILDRLMRRIARRLASGANADGVDEDARPDVLAQVQADAATTWRSSTEARATVRGVERLRAWCEGFSLHVGVVVAAHDRAALERLCRYGARPAFAQERLAWTADGRIAYKLKRPWPDGRTHLVMKPVAFLRFEGSRAADSTP